MILVKKILYYKEDKYEIVLCDIHVKHFIMTVILSLNYINTSCLKKDGVF